MYPVRADAVDEAVAGSGCAPDMGAVRKKRGYSGITVEYACQSVILAPGRAPVAPMRPERRTLVSVHEKTRRHHGLTQRAPRRHP